MANIRIPFLVPKTNKAKVTTWFWQPSATLKKAGWKSQPLGTDTNVAMDRARDLNAKVDAWKNGGPTPKAIEKRKARGTLDALIARYRTEYMTALDPATGKPYLSEKTRENYQTPLKRLSLWAGDQQLAYVTPNRVKILRDTLVGPEDKGGIGHASAHNTLKMLRQLFAFAISIDLVPKGANPATDFNLGAPPPRRTIWKHAHAKAFDEAAYRLGLPSMALARETGLFTAQRESDLLLFTEHQYGEIELFDRQLIELLGDKDGVVKGWILDQKKTGLTQLEIPFFPAFRAKVEDAFRTNRARDRAAGRNVTYLIVDDRTGLPWNKRDFIKAWHAIIDDAVAVTGMNDMLDLVWHDLRRTRVVNLRRQRIPKEQIATVTGTSEQTITAMLDAYGPIDATMTAGTIVASMQAETQRNRAVEEKKEQSA